MSYAHSTLEVLPSDDLSIRIFPCQSIRWCGTAAQLIAEGLLPAAPKLPADKKTVYWETDQFRFSLRRVRPPGWIGTPSSWYTADWWSLTRRTQLTLDYSDIDLLEKRRALERAMFAQSAEGTRLGTLAWRAKRDTAFQAFRASIPALAPKPRKARSVKAGAA